MKNKNPSTGAKDRQQTIEVVERNWRAEVETAQVYRDLCEERDDPRFLEAIRDATNAGYATLIGEELKARLAASVARPLERAKPGPRPARAHGSEPESLELGL